MTEHSPRIYSSSYKNFDAILKDISRHITFQELGLCNINLGFDKHRVKYNMGFAVVRTVKPYLQYLLNLCSIRIMVLTFL